MAYLGNQPVALEGDTSNVDTTQKHPVGTRAYDKSGNEYIYCAGVASCVVGSWVSMDEVNQLALAVADAKGRVGVAMAAIVASSWGWVQVYGKNEIALALASFADNGVIYLTSTDGSIDDSDVAGDLVKGAMGRGAVSGGVITCELNYPFVDDSADD